MDYSEEIWEDLVRYASGVSPVAIEAIKLSERVAFFGKLRELIMQKEAANDEVAAAVLGWAYEKLAEG